MDATTHRSIVDVHNARLALSRYLLPVEREQAGIINAFGRTLAEDLVTESPVPSRNTAAGDGYAVIASDTVGSTKQTPKSMSVLSASAPHGKQLETRTVMRVRAGDPLPDGANAVINATDTFRPEHGPEVLVFAEVEAGHRVIPAGSITPSGEVLLRQGVAIGAHEMQIIASLGKPGVPVRRKPRVAIITTGSRVVDVVEEMGPGEKRNASRYGLVGLLLDSGCDLGRLIHIRDGRIGLERAISDCAACDAVIVAICSQDRHETALEALSNIGERSFDRVQMDPGGGCAFAMAFDRPVFVTEGDSVLETFEAIIRPGLMMMLGRENLHRTRIKASLGSTVKPRMGYTHLIRAFTAIDSDACIAKPTIGHAADVNSLIVIGEDVEIAKRGESVEVILLR